MSDIFKVVKIIDSESIVLNAGYNDKIKENDKFDIYGIGAEVKDPDTGKYLGTLDTIKERITATTIFENMWICKCPVMYGPGSTLTTTISTLFSRDNKQLDVEQSEITNDLSKDTTIHIGDKARKVIYDESTND